MLALLLSACGEPPPPPATAQPPAPVEIPLRDHRLDPGAGDAGVPARQGGPGFSGEGWTTAPRVHATGSPDAIAGGTLTRPRGEAGALERAFVFETLLGRDPVSGEPVPRLATHWQVSDDGRTWRFRIDPSARFSDGSPVTADDVVRSAAEVLADPDRSAAGRALPEVRATAVSRYLVQVRVTSAGWPDFLAYATTVPIASAAGLGSGPYAVDRDDAAGILLSRRPGWWGEGNPVWDGRYNFAAIHGVATPDANDALDRLLRGELDWLAIERTGWWRRELPEHPDVLRGLLARRKLWTDAPRTEIALVADTSRAPLDDARVRRGLQHLLDRERAINQVFSGELEATGGWLVPAPPVAHDELAAVGLLEQAGWTGMDGEGYRVRDGQRLAVLVDYENPASERWLGFFRESARHAGVAVELRLVEPPAPGAAPLPPGHLRAVERTTPAWPDPDRWTVGLPAWSEGTTAYDLAFQPERRATLLRELDRLLADEAPEIQGWRDPAIRVLYWNKLSAPPWGAGRWDDEVALAASWWLDPAREAELAAARADGKRRMDPGPEELAFWRRALGPR